MTFKLWTEVEKIGERKGFIIVVHLLIFSKARWSNQLMHGSITWSFSCIILIFPYMGKKYRFKSQDVLFFISIFITSVYHVHTQCYNPYYFHFILGISLTLTIKIILSMVEEPSNLPVFSLLLQLSSCIIYDRKGTSTVIFNLFALSHDSDLV